MTRFKMEFACVLTVEAQTIDEAVLIAFDWKRTVIHSVYAGECRREGVTGLSLSPTQRWFAVELPDNPASTDREHEGESE